MRAEPQDPNFKAYVVGFLFDPHLERVLCIRKLRPAWQAGKLNGIGGHIEPGETALEAMEREASEEAGLGAHIAWNTFAEMHGFDDLEHPFSVTFLAAYKTKMGTPTTFGPFESRTDEQLEVWWVADLTPGKQDMVENLSWLVGLAVDFLTDGRPTFTRIEYGTA